MASREGRCFEVKRLHLKELGLSIHDLDALSLSFLKSERKRIIKKWSSFFAVTNINS